MIKVYLYKQTFELILDLVVSDEAEIRVDDNWLYIIDSNREETYKKTYTYNLKNIFAIHTVKVKEHE